MSGYIITPFQRRSMAWYTMQVFLPQNSSNIQSNYSNAKALWTNGRKRLNGEPKPERRLCCVAQESWTVSERLVFPGDFNTDEKGLKNV